MATNGTAASTSKQRCQSLVDPPKCPACLVARPDTCKLDCAHMLCTQCANTLIESSIDLYETAIVQCPLCRASTNLEDLDNDASPFAAQMLRLREFANELPPAKMPRRMDHLSSTPTRHMSIARPTTDFERVEFRQPQPCRRKSGYSSTQVSTESLRRISIQYELDIEQQAKLAAIHEKKLADLAKVDAEKQQASSRKRTLDTVLSDH